MLELAPAILEDVAAEEGPSCNRDHDRSEVVYDERYVRREKEVGGGF